MLVWLRVGTFCFFTLAALPCRGRTLQYRRLAQRQAFSRQPSAVSRLNSD
ncbi:MAG: hypothetical protein F6K55_24490 [Moorea sp. SIO4A3]|nr:hypothetical protein [Moorena sp. SIO4A3]NEQ81471.1 hypothetical protein [Moorena sp. SIO2I5]